MLWNFEFRILGEVILIDWGGSCLLRENSCSPTNKKITMRVPLIKGCYVYPAAILMYVYLCHCYM